MAFPNFNQLNGFPQQVPALGAVPAPGQLRAQSLLPQPTQLNNAPQFEIPPELAQRGVTQQTVESIIGPDGARDPSKFTQALQIIGATLQDVGAAKQGGQGNALALLQRQQEGFKQAKVKRDRLERLAQHFIDTGNEQGLAVLSAGGLDAGIQFLAKAPERAIAQQRIGLEGKRVGLEEQRVKNQEDVSAKTLDLREAQLAQAAKIAEMQDATTRRGQDVSSEDRANAAALRDEIARQDRALKERIALAKAGGTKKFSESQSNAALFGARMLTADQKLAELAKSGFDPTKTFGAASSGGAFVGKIPLAGDALVRRLSPQEARQYNTNKRSFISAVLRKESGAAIGKSEFEDADLKYFPQPGDGPEVIAQKRSLRERDTKAMIAASQGAFEAFGLNSQPDSDNIPTDIPEAAINALMDDPTRAIEFDLKFGQGAAERVLGAQ